jgi:SAM-dependent methyltransferase
MRHAHAPTRPAGFGARKLMRIMWNVVTWSDTAPRYVDKVHKLAWGWLTARGAHGHLVTEYGRYVQGRNRARQPRRPDSEHTFFLRNRVQFEVLRDLVRDWSRGPRLRIASIGCSTGAELYSALWSAHTTRPDLELVGLGLDISEASLAAARVARYNRTGRELERLTASRVDDLIAGGLFIDEGESVTVPGWYRECARWDLASVFDSSLGERLGPQDIVFVNNVLCHFQDPQAEQALRNIAGLVDQGGYLFLAGVNPDVKVRGITSLGLTPTSDRVEELYNGDANALTRWPMTYWAPEPFDRKRRDWLLRYGTIFQRVSSDRPSSGARA